MENGEGYGAVDIVFNLGSLSFFNGNVHALFAA